MLQPIHPIFVVSYNSDTPLARNSFPFCLTEIDGFPILQHSIYSFYINGITNFTIFAPEGYRNALESFINKVLNPSNKRARYGLEICQINLICSEKLSEIANLNTQNILFMRADVFYSGVTERLLFLHRQHNSTCTVIFGQNGAMSVKKCFRGCFTIEKQLEPHTFQLLSYKNLTSKNLTENTSDLLKIKAKLLKQTTGTMQIRKFQPAGILLKTEIFTTLAQNLPALSIFDELLEFLTEQSHLPNSLKHPSLTPQQLPPDELICDTDRRPFTFTDPSTPLQILAIQLPEIENQLIFSHNPITIREKVEQMQKSIFNERVRNKNMSVMNFGSAGSFDQQLTPRIIRTSTQMRMTSFAEGQIGVKNSRKLEVFMDLLDRENLLLIGQFVRNSSIYENPLISMKFATIDAQNSNTNIQYNVQLNNVKINAIFQLIGQNVIFLEPLLLQKWSEIDVKQFKNCTNCSIGAGNQICENFITNSQIGNYVSIGEGVEITGSIVFDSCSLKSGRFVNCVFGANCCIEGGEFVNCVFGSGVKVVKGADDVVKGENIG